MNTKSMFFIVLAVFCAFPLESVAGRARTSPDWAYPETPEESKERKEKATVYDAEHHIAEFAHPTKTGLDEIIIDLQQTDAQQEAALAAKEASILKKKEAILKSNPTKKK